MESCALPSAAPPPPLTERERRGETGERGREGGTWVDRLLRDPPQQLGPEQSGQEEFKLQLLPGETIFSEIPHLLRELRLRRVVMGLVLLFSNS